MAKKKGFRELINYEKLGMVYPYNTVTTLRQTVSKKPELLANLSRSSGAVNAGLTKQLRT